MLYSMTRTRRLLQLKARESGLPPSELVSLRGIASIISSSAAARKQAAGLHRNHAKIVRTPELILHPATCIRLQAGRVAAQVSVLIAFGHIDRGLTCDEYDEILTAWRTLANSDQVLLCIVLSPLPDFWHEGNSAPNTTSLFALFSTLLCMAIDHEIGSLAGDFLRTIEGRRGGTRRLP